MTDQPADAPDRACPDWFSPAAADVWAALPARPHLVYVHYEDRLSHSVLEDLIEGDVEDLDDLHFDAARDGADRELADAATDAGHALNHLSVDEQDALREELETRDVSGWYGDQCAKNTGVLTVLVRLPIVDTDEEVATLLGLDTAAHPVTDLGGCDSVRALCHLLPEDLLTLATSDDTDVVTLPVTAVGNFYPSSGSGWVNDLPDGTSATLVMTVAQVRERSRMDGFRTANGYSWWDTCGGFSVPRSHEVAHVDIVAPPEGSAGDTFAALIRDGWPARDAWKAATALHVEPDAAAVAARTDDPSRSVSVPRPAPAAASPSTPARV